ncbi:hypothetical protein [Mongoliibacter ruber]|uniref:Uncharacterized protein n=1 Tax=Mongoliibacter ruber TaxID=1750599 RepID=A0A2T0WPH8_9BACT|nr:hypothetical protein [Mongoliibacter ruber]PRY88590.1 hypothetical protein CLW00_104241 [Mongoliibacter ruber]
MDRTDSLFDRLHSDFSLLLDSRQYIFLIRTGDHIFDDFLFKKIKSDLLHGKDSPNSQSIELKNDGEKIKWVEIIPGGEDFFENLKNLGENQENSSDAKFIYVLPSSLLNTLVDQHKEADILPHCIFLSDKFHTYRRFILEQTFLLKEINNGKEQVSSLFDAPIISKESSISKMYFFCCSYGKENTSITTPRLQSGLSSFHTFLDEKGSDFIKKFDGTISLDAIESFFRSFIYVRKDYFFPLSLELSDIISYTNLPINEAEILLSTASDAEFQILTKTETRYSIKIPEYLKEWKDLVRWIEHEKRAYQQYQRLETLANDYFGNLGTLLSKEQIDQALIWEQEAAGFYVWEKKYNHNKALTSNYILLSQNHLEEQLKTQQKKRARLLKNSIRVSIAVSIAFLLSSFTALIAYLERNSAIKQQELALLAKEEAEESRSIAEIERLQALEAQKNERLALGKAEIERLLALESKAQADIQRSNAIVALDMAKVSEKQASIAREVAEKNEVIANEATRNAEVNFEKSEKLRNQQEARATALEALGHFDNKNIALGFSLAQEAFYKNYNNDGFPLQAEIFKALLYGKILDKSEELNVLLEFPGKHVSLSPSQDEIAVYTINGRISIFEKSSSGFSFKHHIPIDGYVKTMGYLGDERLIYLTLEGQIFETNPKNLKTSRISGTTYSSMLRISGGTNLWLATKAQGGTDIFSTIDEVSTILGETSQNPNQAILVNNTQFIWAADNKLYQSRSPQEKWEYFFSANSPIKSMAWSKTHDCLVIGLENGQIQTLNPFNVAARNEEFSIHASRISHLEIIPYDFGTELMISTGYDGSINLFILDQTKPIASSVSSRISLTAHRSWIREFIMDRKNSVAYSIGNDRMLKIWPLALEELLRSDQQ